jgi:phospholipid-translocating P-type ATPase (flippase)
MVPLSLFVSIELVRLAQGKFMEWDEQMFSSTGVPMIVKNTNLNEDLGKIEYIFSDKTGTLTQNVMKIARWYVISAGEFNEEAMPGVLSKLIDEKKLNEIQAPKVINFLRTLVYCHEVIPSKKEDGEIVYESPSPDEQAILMGLKENNMHLQERSKREMKVSIMGNVEEVKILNVLEFNSDRKRMSIIIHSPQGIELFCKGADSIVCGLLSKDTSKETMNEFQNQIDNFARQGLRTLAVAQRKISEEEYEAFQKVYSQAEKSLVNREENISAACNLIEKELKLIGATAIEDKLQEDVPGTIEYLIQAGLKIWLLTGDKQETAINIGMSSRLILPRMTTLIVNATDEGTCRNMMQQCLDQAKNPGPDSSGNCLVIDGFSLTFALKEFSDMLLELSQQCHTVICCRVTPLQKALVVRLVKNRLKKLSLSIGDGANDVSMIQEADVGVGIMGKEGGQASRVSDYSFVEFRLLKRLLVVHGRHSMLRLGKMTLYSFYKNIAMILLLFWLGESFGWSSAVSLIG